MLSTTESKENLVEKETNQVMEKDAAGAVETTNQMIASTKTRPAENVENWDIWQPCAGAKGLPIQKEKGKEKGLTLKEKEKEKSLRLLESHMETQGHVSFVDPLRTWQNPAQKGNNKGSMVSTKTPKTLQMLVPSWTNGS